jgi:DNA polymerase III epsilon subunit-like protein
MYTVIDFETGGVAVGKPGSAPVNALVSVALLTLDEQLVEVSRTYTLIDEPELIIEDQALAVNGLTREQIRSEGQPIAEVLEVIRAALAGNIPVAHNAPFDIGALVARGFNISHAIDTLACARALLVGGPYKLGIVAQRLGIVSENAHHALGDVLTCASVLRKFALMQPAVLVPRSIRY